MRIETNISQDYITKMYQHFQDRGGAPLAYQVLATHGQAFPQRAARQPALGQIGQCYENAYYLAQTRGLYYVEGLAISRDDIPLPLDHAWCVDHAGRVYDPTWPEGSQYYGMAFDMEALAFIYLQTGYHCVLGNLARLRLDVEAVRALLLNAHQPITVTEEAAHDHR